MADQLQLEVVTPERRVLSEPVNSVTVPGRNGEMQILPGHAALISELKTGVLSYNQDGTTQQLHVSGGFVEVSDDRVSVLAEIAERPEEIDAARARLAREHTEKQLSAWSGTEEDFEKARVKLERSMVRLQLASVARLILECGDFASHRGCRGFRGHGVTPILSASDNIPVHAFQPVQSEKYAACKPPHSKPATATLTRSRRVFPAQPDPIQQIPPAKRCDGRY